MGIIVKAIDKKTNQFVGYLGFQRDEDGNMIRAYEVVNSIAYLALWSGLDTLRSLMANIPEQYKDLKFIAEWDGRDEDLTDAFSKLPQAIEKKK